MARPASSQPTEVELQILRILWRSGGSTAREVHNALAEIEARDTNYSTTVKMLSVMLEKGLVKRDESMSPQVFRAAVSQKVTQRKMLGDLIDKVYNGSALSLVLQALSSRKATPDELTEVRRMLDELERQTRSSQPVDGQDGPFVETPREIR
jgi:BlaI family penicillinase repressor